MVNYFGIHSLRSLIRIVKADLEAKVNTSDIINDLTTDDSSKPLSAAQGKVLDEKITQIDPDGSGTVADAAKLGGHEPSYFATAEQLEEISGEMEEIDGDTVEQLWNEVSVS